MVARLCHLFPIQQGEAGIGDVLKVKTITIKGAATEQKAMTKTDTATRGEGQGQLFILAAAAAADG